MRIDLKIALYCLFFGLGIAVAGVALPLRFPNIPSWILDIMIYGGLTIAFISLLLVIYELKINPRHSKENSISFKLIVSLLELSTIKAKGYLTYRIIFSNDSDNNWIIESIRMMTLSHEGLIKLNQFSVDEVNYNNNYKNMFNEHSLMSLVPHILPIPNLPKLLTPHELWVYEIKEPFEPNNFIKRHELPSIKRIPITLSIHVLDYKGRLLSDDLGFHAEIMILNDINNYNTSSAYIQHELLID